MEIKIAKKYAAAPVRAEKQRKLKDFEIERLGDWPSTSSGTNELWLQAGKMMR